MLNRIPAVIPPGWNYFRDRENRQAIWQVTNSGLKILVSIDPTGENKAWERHVSFSREDRYPAWEEMVDFLYNAWFMDPAEEITMVIPPRNRPDLYINLHPNTFHWWQKEA